MLKEYFRKIKSFLLKDVNDEQETKELAILLRFLCILYILYYFISSIFLAFINHFSLSVIVLLFIGLIFIAFVNTYTDLTKKAMRIFHVTLYLSTILLTLISGWSTNFQWNMLIPIMIIFFDINASMRNKMRFAQINIISFIALAVLSHLTDHAHTSGTLFSFFFQTFQTISYSCFILVISYFFCTKFNQAENKLRKINDKLRIMASLDTLTQLPNRRNMNEHLQTLVYDFNHSGKPFCIAIADVDFFKHINDNYGHDAGDYILTSLADMFKATMRGRGCAARWGGEEFLFTFEGMSGKQAYIILESLRMQIEKKKFLFKDHSIQITMTFGLEEYSQIIGAEATIAKADTKLYQGKSSGRNQVVF